MHRLRIWTRGHVEVLRAWQRYTARHFVAWPRLTALYTQLKALPTAQQTQWRRRCKATLWGVALCLAASGVQPVWADTITVDGTCTLVDAITTANSDTNTGGCVQTGTVSAADTIVLTVDTTLTTANNSTFGATGLPVISSVITIVGNGHTIMRIPADPDQFRLIAINPSGDLTVQDTTLSGGLASVADVIAGGGAILNYNGQLRLEDCTVSGNSAPFGGGVYSHTLHSSTFSLVNSTLSGNSAYFSGGGVSSSTHDSSTFSLVNSTLSGNSAYFSGGGVSSFTTGSSMVSLVNSTLSGNSAAFGGGVYTYDNSTFSLVNSTLSGNSADEGGGVYSRTYSTSTVALHQNLIAGNTAPYGDEVRRGNFGGNFLVNDSNLFGHNGVSTAAALSGFSAGITDITATSDGNDPTTLSAILDPTLANNGGPTQTHALPTGSPAIDAAGVCGLATDQRGVTRPQGVACDIGAFEVEAIPSSEVCGNCLDDDGDNKIDVADEDCPALPLNKEKGAFGFKPDPDEDQLALSATFPLGPVINPPNEGVIVQFFDAAGQLACVQIPAGTGGAQIARLEGEN
ncbi:MAG: hypothetical protein HYZ50_12720 [Deltaproteobacteria bacterium]|nr:hypothetical protein [Deltaproteobacteria bacterium]